MRQQWALKNRDSKTLVSFGEKGAQGIILFGSRKEASEWATHCERDPRPVPVKVEVKEIRP